MLGVIVPLAVRRLASTGEVGWFTRLAAGGRGGAHDIRPDNL